ncbi:MAG: stage sporulation protein [Actinomycetia bacterium]|nr:stage sporulation protein [Actinomycetes bacterium]
MATRLEHGIRRPGSSPVARRVATARRAWTDSGRARPPTYLLLVATIAVLNVVGLVMVLSASSVQSISNYGSAWFFFERQLLWCTLGVIAFVVLARVDYRQWRRFVTPLLIVSVVLLLLVLVPGVGIMVSGSRRWLGFGSIRIQPSEVAKLALLLYCADVMSRREKDLHDWRLVLRPVLVVFAGIALLVIKEPDMDSTIVLALIVATALIVGGIRARHLALIGSVGVGLAALLAIAEPYRRARVFTFLQPLSDKSNAGYQITQSLIALGSGGWTGVGLGASRAKWMFLPNAHTDFIFAIIGEELGLVGCILVIGLFLAFAVLGTRVAMHAPDRFGMLLAAGVTVWVVGQAVINIGAVIGVLPVSGIPLPFVSFGGSALLFTMAAAGLLANVARQART